MCGIAGVLTLERSVEAELVSSVLRMMGAEVHQGAVPLHRLVFPMLERSNPRWGNKPLLLSCLGGALGSEAANSQEDGLHLPL